MKIGDEVWISCVIWRNSAEQIIDTTTMEVSATMAVIAMAMAATMNTKSWTYEFGDWRIRTCWNSVVDTDYPPVICRMRQALDQQQQQQQNNSSIRREQ
jgi:hypothetical protein